MLTDAGWFACSAGTIFLTAAAAALLPPLWHITTPLFTAAEPPVGLYRLEYSRGRGRPGSIRLPVERSTTAPIFIRWWVSDIDQSPPQTRLRVGPLVADDLGL